MNKIKLAGYLTMLLATAGAAFYILWFFGYIPQLDKELAVKIPVLIITLAAFLTIGFLGYIMATTKQPITIKPTTTNLLNQNNKTNK